MSNLEKKNRIEFLISLWKTTIETQQHFNEMLMRVRNFGFVMMAAVLGASGFSLRSGYQWHDIPVATFIVGFGILLWLLIFFLELKWYTPLLIGAVNTGIELEDKLKDELEPEIEGDLKHFLLSKSIKNTSSNVYLNAPKKIWNMDSSTRSKFFHLSFIFILFVLGIATSLLSKDDQEKELSSPPPSPSSSSPARPAEHQQPASAQRMNTESPNKAITRVE